MGILLTTHMGFLFTITMGILFTIVLGIQFTISNREQSEAISVLCHCQKQSNPFCVYADLD